MLSKITLIALGFTLWLFGIPTIYPIEAINPTGRTIEPIEKVIMPKCVVHPIGEEYDLNLDGVVSDADIMAVADTWNSKLHDANYNSAHDFNFDNKIDIYDIMSIASKWGESCHDLYPKKEKTSEN